jgi:hypothetical protein
MTTITLTSIANYLTNIYNYTIGRFQYIGRLLSNTPSIDNAADNVVANVVANIMKVEYNKNIINTYITKGTYVWIANEYVHEHNRRYIITGGYGFIDAPDDKNSNIIHGVYGDSIEIKIDSMGGINSINIGAAAPSNELSADDTQKILSGENIMYMQLYAMKLLHMNITKSGEVSADTTKFDQYRNEIQKKLLALIQKNDFEFNYKYYL